MAPLNKGLSPQGDWGLRWEGPTGPHRSVSEVSGRKPKQWRCRRSEAEPHAPTGLSPQVTGGRQTKVARPSGPHRSVSEVSCKGTEAVEVPAERSGAACPDGAVTAGDWGWTDEGRQTFRAAPERQRGFRKETEAVEVPAQRSGAACPTGAVTAR